MCVLGVEGSEKKCCPPPTPHPPPPPNNFWNSRLAMNTRYSYRFYLFIQTVYMDVIGLLAGVLGLDNMEYAAAILDRGGKDVRHRGEFHDVDNAACRAPAALP